MILGNTVTTNKINGVLLSGQTIVDMTFGAGGHTRKLLETVPGLRIFGLDRDPIAHSYAQKLAQETEGRFIPLLGRFSEIKSLLKQHDVTEG